MVLSIKKRNIDFWQIRINHNFNHLKYEKCWFSFINADNQHPLKSPLNIELAISKPPLLLLTSLVYLICLRIFLFYTLANSTENWNSNEMFLGKKGIFGQIPVESRYQVRGHTFLRIYGLIFTTVDIGLIPLFLDGQIIFTHALCWYSNIMKIILCCKYKFLFGKKIVIIKRTAVPLLLNVVHPSQVPGYTWLWLLLPLHNFWPNMKHNMSMTYCKLKGEWVFASR